MVCIKCNELCFGCGCVLPKLSLCLQLWGSWDGRASAVERQQARDIALCWHQEAGLCSWHSPARAGV